MTFNAVVLAGSRGGIEDVAAYAGVDDKAMIVVGGRTMLDRVVDALRRAGADRIVVAVSSQAVRDHAVALNVEVIEAASGPSESTARALALLGAPLLVTTADHALLEPEWITDFLADVPDDGDVAALLARRDIIERDVPGTSRTYLRFADSDWSGCNLFYLATPRAMAAVTFWREVEADRKRPWRIVRRLGPGLLLRYLLRRLTLVEALAHVGRSIGVRAFPVASRSGLAAVDVDKRADLDLVRHLLADAAPGAGR